MVSKAVQKSRLTRRAHAGRARKKKLQKKGTTPTFASVFGMTAASESKNSK